jgi:hypothetical protein
VLRSNQDVLEARLALCALIAMCALAAWVGVGATHDLTWPAGPDTSRDIANAQSLLSWRPLDDAYYRHELRWYNPLTSAVGASLSVLLRAPLGVIFARAWAWLNLLGPIAFFALVWRLFGPTTAMFSTAGLIFFVPSDGDPPLSATYSAMPLPVHFVQAFFYLGVATLLRARRVATTGAWAAAGIVLGVTFLGHTAPFLILSILAMVQVVAETAGNWRNSVPFRSVPFRSVPFRSVPFRSVRLPSTLVWPPPSALRFGLRFFGAITL